MDGVHPLHNSINCNGWIKKGTEKGIKANAGRDRLNINGREPQPPQPPVLPKM